MSNTTEIPPHVVSMVTLEKIVIMFKEDRDERKKYTKILYVLLDKNRKILQKNKVLSQGLW